MSRYHNQQIAQGGKVVDVGLPAALGAPASLPALTKRLIGSGSYRYLSQALSAPAGSRRSQALQEHKRLFQAQSGADGAINYKADRAGDS